MSDIENLQLFEDQAIRTAWNEEEEEWYFSIVDVIGVLTEQTTQRRASTYWAVLKKRLKEVHPAFCCSTGFFKKAE